MKMLTHNISNQYKTYTIPENKQMKAQWAALVLLESRGTSIPELMMHDIKRIKFNGIPEIPDVAAGTKVIISDVRAGHESVTGTGLELEVEITTNNQISKAFITNAGTGYNIGNPLIFSFPPSYFYNDITFNFSSSYFPDGKQTQQDIKNLGFNGKEFIEVFPASNLKTTGYTVTELKDAELASRHLATAGYTGRETLAGGYPNTDLKRGRFDPKKLINEEVPFTLDELKTSGFVPIDFRTMEKYNIDYYNNSSTTCG